ncbi:NRDE family protein [Endozoicomonas sp. SCSIO W0465]|uniref:NRDE family protein n=1 Tax=Endozoicomonas sp. SCSIO W0465 TaxID=2918516 RepID=UPI002074CC0E|nr:NRDE family protein [Endozoicomonas sp. SCSIO W0465]USE36481.1 NRDE family protein [Endozoicomonas sp. SCSIO W0465]
MCLIVFSWQPDSQYPLILAANRDEFYRRPTQAVDFWKDWPDVFGGRDLEAGGSWMAINRNGRFAAVTNYRETPNPAGLYSRGALVANFVTGSQPAFDYLHTLQQQTDKWAGFNLLVKDSTGLYYFSNRAKEQKISPLSSGIYGLSNHLLDTPWPKLLRARHRFTRAMQESIPPDSKRLVELMQDSYQPPEEQLPDTGVSKEVEKRLSSCFIASKDYGTRNTSVLMIDHQNQLQWAEQGYLQEGVTSESRQFKIKLQQNQLS